MTYRVLLVEDDESARAAVTALLTRYGYDVVAPTEFDDVVGTCAAAAPHVVLLDINLPVFDGFHVCRELRRRSDVPIIFVTSRDTDMDQVLGMTVGGDDYVTKPYAADVLLARIGAVLRRAYGRGPVVDTLEHNGLRLDLATGTAHYGSATAELTRNELRLLHVLLANNGTIVSRDRLMERLWSSNAFVDDNTLTVNIGRLRTKLAELGLPDFVQTRRGLGYIVP